jgi:hypothetical protein
MGLDFIQKNHQMGEISPRPRKSKDLPVFVNMAGLERSG